MNDDYTMTFVNIEYLLLLLLLVPWVIWHFLLKWRHEPAMKMATTEMYRHAPMTLRMALIHVPFLLRMLSFSMLVIVMARPQTYNSLSESETEGIDIMMAMDISTSMMAPDIKPNRIEAAKQVAYEFISSRPDDNIGLTLFGGEAFTQCPLTTDHATLLGMFKNVSCDLQQNGVISPGTAIGMGIAGAVSHLEKSKSKSKVIILLTDGENNTGEISPLMATDLAKKYAIRIYTVSLGKKGKIKQVVAQLPNGEAYEEEVESAYNPETLQKIARETGGLYYQAGSKEKLREIYQDIDRLEKTKLKVTNYDKRYEAYMPFAWVALIALILEILLRTTWYRRIPS